MAPEQVSDAHSVDTRADIYTAGRRCLDRSTAATARS